jgi:hypothetical protein
MADIVTSLLNGVDKITDILNVGRLIFYTSAGFCAILPAAMVVRLLGQGPSGNYWRQFTSDLVVCARRGEVWAAALVLGFVIANLAYAAVFKKLARPTQKDPDPQGFAYQYPSLSAGGATPKTEHDLAAWWVSEYYRYAEIAVYIPYGLLLSLPLYTLYSLVYLILKSNPSEPFSIGPAHYAFALWALIAVIGWGMVWPWYWIPKVVTPIYLDSSEALCEVIAGQAKFSSGKSTDSSAKSPEKGSA